MDALRFSVSGRSVGGGFPAYLQNEVNHYYTWDIVTLISVYVNKLLGRSLYVRDSVTTLYLVFCFNIICLG